MKLIIVRHAEVNLDYKGYEQNGGVIGALSDTGKNQAEKLAHHLSAYKVGYIYSSDILRAVATAYVISDSMPDVTVMLTKDLRIKDTDEDADHFKKRLTTFLDGLIQKYERETVIVVSHSDAMQILFGLLGCKSKIIPGLSSISEFDLKHNADPVAIRVNYIKHLA